MKFFAIDLETTGLDPEVNNIIEFGGVFVDTKRKVIKEYQCFVEHDVYTGSSYAIHLNKRIFENIVKKEGNIVHISNFNKWFNNVLMENYFINDKLVFAGKNVARFDIPFLKKVVTFEYQKESIRTIDPGSSYIDFENDMEVPNLEQCLIRAGATNSKVTHNAVNDAWDVIYLIAKQYKLKWLEEAYLDTTKITTNE